MIILDSVCRADRKLRQLTECYINSAVICKIRGHTGTCSQCSPDFSSGAVVEERAGVSRFRLTLMPPSDARL